MKVKLTEAEKYQEKVFAYIDRQPACVIPINYAKIKDRERFQKVIIEYVKRGIYNGYRTEVDKDFTLITRIDEVLPLQTKKFNANMQEHEG